MSGVLEWESLVLAPDRRRDGGTSQRALIIVNSGDYNRALMELLWERCSHHLCADGGANRLYDSFGDGDKEEAARRRYVPEMIVGDLDSLRNDVRHFYERAGSKLILIQDQDWNDLEKTISSFPEEVREGVVLGGFGGRFDQQMASIQALYRCLPSAQSPLPSTVPSCSPPSPSPSPSSSSLQASMSPSSAVAVQNHPTSPPPVDKLSIIDANNITFLLRPGRHVIIPLPTIEGPTCGLLPIGGRTTVTSRGLQWDVHEQELAFGHLISSSNRITESTVYIETSHALVWTTELQLSL